MGKIFDEATAELEGVLQRFADRPKVAYWKLLLMALEREQIVSLAYREKVIADRLDRMPIPDDVRQVIAHAVVWVWKDEEMHTTYVRGELLKAARGSAKVRVLLEQLGGAVAGWATGVLQHSDPRKALLSRKVAGLIVFSGKVAGKVPTEVGKLLRAGPFREFCLLNADLEMASGSCWNRILRLAGDVAGADAETLIEFRRVVEDEDRHRRVFEAIADALTDDDRLAPGVTADNLATRIGDVGRAFLPRALRSAGDTDHPIGSGGLVWSHEGAEGESAVTAFHRLLAECDLGNRLRACAARLDKPVSAMRVVIKGCFMLGYHRDDPSPVVAPKLIEELVRYFRELGVVRVVLAEARNVYDRFFYNRGVKDVARYFGFSSPLYEVVDLTLDPQPHFYPRGLGPSSIGRAWAGGDFRVSFVKLRSHPVCQASLSIGNLEGIGGRTDEFIFLDRRADRATPLMALIDEYPPHYALIDGFETASDGLTGMMGCLRPIHARRFYAGADALTVDMVAIRHLGVRDPSASALLSAAAHWFGGWPAAVEVIGTDAPVRGWRGPQSTDFHALLSLMALPVYVWGSGRGSLFLPAMDTRAFPPQRQAGPLIRAARRLIRALLGMP